MYFVWLLLALSGFQGSLPQGTAGCPKDGQPGVYSRYSIYLCFQNFDTGQRHLDILSPNGIVRYVIDGHEGRFYVQTQAVGERFLVGNDEEFIWSPDSRAGIITMSFGASGPTKSEIDYVYQKPNVNAPAVTRIIQKSFAVRHPKLECSDSANVAGLGWTDDSKNALFVAEIPPTPDCGDAWGYFDVYVVSIPGRKIVHVYPMAEALTRFKRFLGPGLRRDVPKLP